MVGSVGSWISLALLFFCIGGAIVAGLETFLLWHRDSITARVRQQIKWHIRFGFALAYVLGVLTASGLFLFSHFFACGAL